MSGFSLDTSGDPQALERSPYRMDQTDLLGRLSIGELRRVRHTGAVVLVGPARVLYATYLPDVSRVEMEGLRAALQDTGARLDATIEQDNAGFFERIRVQADTPTLGDDGKVYLTEVAK